MWFLMFSSAFILNGFENEFTEIHSVVHCTEIYSVVDCKLLEI